MKCEKCLGTNYIRVQNYKGLEAMECLDCGKVNPT